jgi:hypothetical protein
MYKLKYNENRLSENVLSSYKSCTAKQQPVCL